MRQGQNAALTVPADSDGVVPLLPQPLLRSKPVLQQIGKSEACPMIVAAMPGEMQRSNRKACFMQRRKKRAVLYG